MQLIIFRLPFSPSHFVEAYAREGIASLVHDLHLLVIFIFRGT